jgi:translation initiation factor 3 subunit G
MASTIKKTWADEIDDGEEGGLDSVVPPVELVDDRVDENGIRTTVEYVINDEGKRVKITKRTRRTLQKSVVEHAVAERKAWPKFGRERGNKPGPDRATTTVGESVVLKLGVGNKSSEPEQSPEQSMKANLAKAGAGKVTCRLCKGDHFTAKCPYKDTLSGLDVTEQEDPNETPSLNPNAASSGPSSGPGTGGTGGKYVPPSMRAGAGASVVAGSGGRSGADLPTLRVTNVSEDTAEQDLRDLFSRFGRVARVYVGRDRETGAGKGFAFVSFEDRECAKKAMEKVHGMGYDNLILNVGWSVPRGEGR